MVFKKNTVVNCSIQCGELVNSPHCFFVNGKLIGNQILKKVMESA